MLLAVQQTEEFEEWLDGLTDRKAQGIIRDSLLRAEGGNLGDAKPLGDKVGEISSLWPRLRTYFKREGSCVGDRALAAGRRSRRRATSRKQKHWPPRFGRQSERDFAQRSDAEWQLNSSASTPRNISAPRRKRPKLFPTHLRPEMLYIAAAIGAIARARSMTYMAEATGLNRTALYEAFSEGGESHA